MCNFVARECIAIGPHGALDELNNKGLPGTLGPITPLVSESGKLNPKSELSDYSSVILKTDPGLEIFAISKMSAVLGNRINKGQAAVDLNHYMPWGASEPITPEVIRLSPYAQSELDAVRHLLRSGVVAGEPHPRVAVLDSGLASDYSGHREINYFDYSQGGRLAPANPQSDPLGHGTRVVSVLDQILPNQVGLSVGRLPSGGNSLTVLAVVQAYADIVARQSPNVINLSIAPRSNSAVCPHCRKRTTALTFFSSFFPLIMRLAGRSPTPTITVMAAGNEGQVPNSRWLTKDLDTLLLAVAENRFRQRARYSSALEGPNADLFSASAFGGDDPDDTGSSGFFTDGDHGTSFAAPILSALALLPRPAATHPIGSFVQEKMREARAARE